MLPNLFLKICLLILGFHGGSDVDSALRPLHRVDMGSFADVSELHAVPITLTQSSHFDPADESPKCGPTSTQRQGPWERTTSGRCRRQVPSKHW
jgi:hypothetical protein